MSECQYIPKNKLCSDITLKIMTKKLSKTDVYSLNTYKAFP